MRVPALLALGLLLLAGCSDADGPAVGPGQADPGQAAQGWAWSDDLHGVDLVSGSGVPFGLAEFALAPSDEAAAFLVGGFTDAGGGSPLVMTIDFATERTGGLVVPPYPLPVHHAQAAVVDRALYVFGGYVGGAPLPGALVGVGPGGWPQTPLGFRLALDAAADAGWQPIAPLPAARSAGGAVALDGQVYLVGGYGLDGFTPEVLRYDPGSNAYTALADLPTPRDHLNVLAHAGLVYAVAGRVNDGAAWDDLGEMEVYDPAADAWTSLPEVPLGRGGQAAAFLGDRLVVVGGERAEGQFTVYDTAHAYDVATRTWGELPAMPEARHGGGLLPWGDAVYYLGGARLDGSLAAATLRLGPATTG